MTTIGIGTAASMIAASAYHDSHLDDIEAKRRAAMAAHPSAAAPATPEDIKAEVAEVIAATRALALRGQR